MGYCALRDCIGIMTSTLTLPLLYPPVSPLPPTPQALCDHIDIITTINTHSPTLPLTLSLTPRPCVTASASWPTAGCARSAPHPSSPPATAPSSSSTCWCQKRSRPSPSTPCCDTWPATPRRGGWRALGCALAMRWAWLGRWGMCMCGGAGFGVQRESETCALCYLCTCHLAHSPVLSMLPSPPLSHPQPCPLATQVVYELGGSLRFEVPVAACPLSHVFDTMQGEWA